MRLRQIAERVSWPLCLAIAFAFVLFHQWYFSAGYITYGDFTLFHPRAVLPDAFHLWIFSEGLGRADAVYWWQRAFLGALFFLHIDERFAERLVWLYFSPALFVSGLYVLAKILTHDRTASGVAALAGILNVDVLVRIIGGHDDAFVAIALGPWILVGVLQAVRTRRAGWLGFIILASAVAAAYEPRWALPACAIAAVLATVVGSDEERYNVKPRLLVIAACALGLILPNLPWLAASIGAPGSFSLELSSSYGNPIWVHRLSLATFWDALAIWNPTFGSDFDRGPFTVLHMPWWGGIFAAVVVFSVAVSRRALAIVFFVLFLTGVLLYKGSQPPFGAAYIWAFQHIPLFNLYREPLKFGAATSLCACMVLAYGVSALRARPLAHLLGAAAVCAIVIALAAPALHKPGALLARSPDPAYATVQRIVARDPGFSRVLWLPGRSRWVTGSRLHPIADGTWLGSLDWADFRSRSGLDDDTTEYVYSPLFSQLLLWAGFRYVVIDCSTEIDAVFRSDSFSCVRFEQALSRNHAFHHIATLGPASVFRLVGAAAPALWSSSDALLANGAPLSLNAGALTGAFGDLTPVVISSDVATAIPFRSEAVFDSAVQVSPSTRNLQQIIGADSVDLGPTNGDAVIEQQRLAASGMRVLTVADGASTIAYSGTLSGTPPREVGALARLPNATMLSRNRGESRLLRREPAWGLETSKFSIPIYEKPVLRINASPFSSGAHFVPLFELRDARSRQQYVLFGPSFGRSDVPRAEINIRDWLFRTVVENRSYDSILGLNDGFDRLLLTRVRLAQLGNHEQSPQRFSLAVRALDTMEGYSVRSVRAFRSNRFSCACSKSARPWGTGFAFRAFGGRRAGWMRGVVAIHARPISYSGIISRQTADAVSGTSTVAGQPFLVRRDQITRLEPAPDATLIDMHLTSPASGVLLFRGTTDPRLTLQLFFRVHSARGVQWIAQDIPYGVAGKSRDFIVRADLWATVRRAGFNKIDDAMLLLKYRNPHDKQPTAIDLSDVAIASEAPGTSPRAKLIIAKGSVNTTLSAGRVPLAVRFSTGETFRRSTARQAIVPAQDVDFRDQTRHKWLVFSERFDPAWALMTDRGVTVPAVHVPANGGLNAWYVPAGLHGAYRIRYTADGPARFGALIALAGAGACGALALTLLLPMRSRSSGGLYRGRP